MKEKWGFLRETSEDARKSGNDKLTGLKRTGLDVYLRKIFPVVNDWIHDRIVGSSFNGHKLRIRPDYRSESLKIVVEFDGLSHYTKPSRIKQDIENTEMYERLGYKVVRIPYFIQLTRTAIKTLFNVDVGCEMFDPSIPSLGISDGNPAFLCPAGLHRMAEEFVKFPEQYAVNIKSLKDIDDEFITGVRFLEEEYSRIVKLVNPYTIP